MAKTTNKNIKSYTVKVAGVTYDGRQKVLMGLRNYMKNEDAKVTLSLVREPENEKDTNAVKVIAKWVNKAGEAKKCMIGYVNGKFSRTIAGLIDGGTYVTASKLELTNTKTVGASMQLSWNQPEKNAQEAPAQA